MVTKLPFSEETVGEYLSSNCYSHEEEGNYTQGGIDRTATNMTMPTA